jgi:hypothetical protein
MHIMVVDDKRIKITQQGPEKSKDTGLREEKCAEMLTNILQK